MPLPAAIIKKTVKFGPYLDYQGVPRRGEFVFIPSHSLVWVETGTPVIGEPMLVKLDNRGNGQIELPATDQDGYSDGQGNSITNFSYTVRRLLDGVVKLPKVIIQLPVEGASEIDLDLMAPMPSSASISVMMPVVLSVADLTGSITAAALVEKFNIPEQIALAIAEDGTVTTAATLAVEAAAAELDLMFNSTFTKTFDVITTRPDPLVFRDQTGQVSMALTDKGNVRVGVTEMGVVTQIGTGHAFRIRDLDGRIAMSIDNTTGTVDVGKLTVAGAPVNASATITEVHILISAGQSNNSGRGLPYSAELDPPDPRIFMYGSKTGSTSGIVLATTPLDSHDTATGLAPLNVIAREYIKNQPANVVVLLVPAAHGNTSMYQTNSTSGVWDPSYSGPYTNLTTAMIAQYTAAVAAATAKWGFAPSTKAMFWHQGEYDASGDATTYATAFDAMVAALRTAVGSNQLPIILGGILQEWINDAAGRTNIQKVHIDTPLRLTRTSYTPSPNNGSMDTTGNRVHGGREWVIRLGKRMYEALERARTNVTGLLPMMPQDISVTAVAGVVRAEWRVPFGRVTSYQPEMQVDGGSWVAMTGRLTTLDPVATMSGVTGSTVSVRISTTNGAGTSATTIPVTIGL